MRKMGSVLLGVLPVICVVSVLLSDLNRLSAAEVPETRQISEVTLERSCGAFDTDCHAYKLILRRDGTATQFSSRLQGPRHGRFPSYLFYRLIHLIDAVNYPSLKAAYGKSWRDGDSVVTSVVRGGKRKTVEHQSFQGPPQLFGVEMAIDGIAFHIEWEKGQVNPSAQPDNGMRPTANSGALMREIWP